MTRFKLILWAVLAGMFAVRVEAQLPSLPELPVPAVPAPGEIIPDATRGTTGTLRQLTRARVLRIERLAREHRAELDRDPAGELVVRAEVIGIDVTATALRRALDDGFLLRRVQQLPELALEVSVLQTPEGWSASRGLKRLRKLDPEGTYDFNHVYLGSETGASANPRAANGQDVPRGSTPPRRVGLIDSGVDTAHEVFANTRFRRFGCDGKSVPAAHGTAVAAILVRPPAEHELFAADVYCGLPTGGAIDSVAAALGWLARERVAVINVSLVGPRNALLERVVKTLVARGFALIAAVGNDGPASPPLYPAAYDGVVGVTGLDARQRVLLEACRGSHVDFAAEGTMPRVAMESPDVYAEVRGTSFAAPVVAALFAAEFQFPAPVDRERLVQRWAAAASDLGRRGRDDVYGAGRLAHPTTSVSISD